MRKLHIGAGDHPLPGWENTDVAPCGPAVRYLDATQPFPLPDASIDRIFSEHMIEHVPLAAGQAMLRECHRVLVPGGRIRISMPSLERLFELLWNREREGYIAWACRLFAPGAPVRADVVINHLVRGFGHQFIWSQESLVSDLQEIGFRHFRWPKIGESGDPEFFGLENSGRMPEGFLQIETFTIEATKPNA